MRRGWVIGLMLVGLALLSATPLLAHANLERSDPPVGSILMTAPDIIQLSFTEPLEPRFSGITLLDAGGQLLDLPPSVVSVADPTQMSLLPGDLPDGLYTVSWRVLSSADGHATQGAFTFTIGVAPEGASSVAAASERFAADGVVIRWLNIVSMALVTGGIGFWLFVWTPCAFGAQPAADRRMRWLIWAGWLLLGISGVLALLLQLSTAENVPLLQSLSSPALAEFVSETRYGRLWLVRMGLWLALGVALLLADGTRRWLWTALALSAGILLTNSLYSHASISPDFAAAVARAEDEVTRLQTQLLAQTREAQRVQRAAEQAQFLTRAADAAAPDVTPNASDRKCPRCGNAMPGAVNSCRCGYTVETSTANTVSLFAHEPGIAHGKPSKSK